MTEAAELIVTLRGADVGLSALLRRVETDLAKTDQTTDKAEGSILRYAQAQARLASASGDTAGAVRLLSTAIASSDRASIASISAQTQLARANTALARSAGEASSSVGALPRTFAGLTSEMQSAAAGMLGFGAAMSTAVAVFNSFQDAFNFKAQLDATTTSINAQLKGVRDSGQVWSEAAAFAQTYKLTQQETTEAIAASIGVMRASKAPIEDVLGVLARMQVLSPEQSLQEAAIALKALASGDTTSLVTRFEVGRDVANQMKAEIAGGADAVAVMNTFLSQTGIGMDVLAAKTTGAAGAIKDAAVASEQLKLAQADFANGPGLVLLQAQIEVTRGATRALSADWQAMGSALGTAFADPVGPLTLLAGALGITQTHAQTLATQIRDTDAAQQGATSGGTSWAAAIQQTGTAAEQAAAQIAAQTAAIQADAGEALINEANTKVLSQAKLDLAAQAQAAANGVLASGANINAEAARLAASSSLVDQLTAAYLRLAIASGQAQAAADKAAGASRLAGQKNAKGAIDNSGSIGFNAPGRQSTSDVLGTIKATQATILQEEKKAEADRLKVKKGGGGARVSAEEKTQEKLANIVEDYQDKIAKIEQDGLVKRRNAENSLRQSQLSGRAGFYASLSSIDDNALRQDLSARYEDAATAATAIAQTQGADAAQAYLEASRQAIEGEADIQAQINALRNGKDSKGDAKDATQLLKDSNQADYLAGILQLTQNANAEELRQIQEKGSAIASEQATQYAQAEKDYAEHLDRLSAIAAKKGFGLAIGAANAATGSTTTPGATPTGASVPATTGKATPVIDIATPAAVDAQTGRLEGKLSEIVAGVQAVADRVRAVESAIGSLRQSRATAGG